MHVVYLTIIVSTITLIHSSISDTMRCPADGITRCGCMYNEVYCNYYYAVNNIPVFGNSNNIYEKVSYIYNALI